MPLPGDQSTAYGIRFEDRWTAHCAYRVLREEAQAIRLGAPGVEGHGYEFWLRFPDRVEYHQAKRQNAGEGRWTIGQLASRGVLRDFFEKLQNDRARCVFVSTDKAGELDELADFARQAVSWSEFEREYLTAERRRAAFHGLLSAWDNSDPEIAYGLLSRIEIAALTEPELATMNALEAEIVLEGDSASAVPVLIQVLRDRVGHFLTAHDIWSALPAGHGPAQWRGTKTATTALREANARYIRSRRDTLIGGELIQRHESRQLRELLAKNRVVVADGAAGMGKSDVLLGLAEDLARDGVPFLALRLDRLTPTLRPDVLGQELGLPASPPAVLAGVAQGEQAVLLIDQLDIVSSTAGRHPQFFDCVSEMLSVALSAPNLRIVLACRTFDLVNDARLRGLVRGSERRPVVSVGPLPETVVRSTVESLGYAAAELTPTQCRLLAVPMHLALLGEIATASAGRRLDFVTARDLFEAFWEAKQEDANVRLGRPTRWTEVIDGLADHMSGNQVLRAPVDLVDAWAPDARVMASGRVLLRDGPNYSFFHETFFDYAFARRFIAHGKTLPELLANDQWLFRRAQVRQILAHERASAPERYHADLRFLLSDPTVRFHITELVVAWLGEVTPTDQEWKLLEPFLLDRESSLHARALRTLQAPGWLAHADQHGRLHAYLERDDELTDDVVSVLARVDARFAGRAAALLSPYVAVSERWSHRLAWLVGRSDLAQDRAQLDLFLELLDAGVLDQTGVAASDFWYIAHDLPDSHPHWAMELLGRWLRNRREAAKASGEDNPFNSVISRHLHLYEYVTQSASSAPLAFFEHIWPVILEIIEQTSRPAREGCLVRDDVWSLRHYTEDYGVFSDQLLAGGEAAFVALAADYPERFEEILTQQWHVASETVMSLIYRGFVANPSRFADRAIEFLVDDPRRLRVAHAEDDHWATRQLLEAITPQASAGALDRLERVLLTYYTPWERSVPGHREFGYSQFTLLGGIAESRRSSAVAKRIAEWQRKFRVEAAREPEGVQGGFVPSPIPEDAAEKMTDEQWRSAIAHYANEEGRDFLKGGAYQLASVLERLTALAPARFATLALSLPDHANPVYFESILRGVAAGEDELPTTLTGQLMIRCHALPDRPCGRWIAYPLRKHAHHPIPDELLEIIAWYAVHDPDPSSDRPAENDARPEQELLQHGLNSVRGGMAYEIARLVDAQPDNLAALRPAIDQLATDTVLAVRAMAAEIPLAMLRHHHKVAPEVFLACLDGANDLLLATRHAHEFLRYRAAHDFVRYESVIQRMLASHIPAVLEAGAVQATLVALDNDDARPLAQQCLNGTIEQRRGAAKVYAANLGNARFRSDCEQALSELFHDPAKEVRDAAAGVLRTLKGPQLGEFEQLVQRLLESEASGRNHSELLLALTETTAPVPALALKTCKRFLDLLGDEAADIRTRVAAEADQVSQILLRAYSDTSDVALKTRALDLIDRSLQLNIYGAEKALLEHDRSILIPA